MQAIILAAGMGRRLGELTAENTKCMIKVNGERLIDRMIRQIKEADINKIIVVVGYKGDNLKKWLSVHYPDLDISFIENQIYDKSNNIYSLSLASDKLEEDDTILLESDLILDDKIIPMLVNSEYSCAASVAKYETWMDGTMVKIDNENNIISFVPKKSFKFSDVDSYYKTVNVYKFSKEFAKEKYVPFLDAYSKTYGNNEYYEQVLRIITFLDSGDIKALPIADLKWYEIDDVQDLDIAEALFAEKGEEQLSKYYGRFGGFWRYPGLLDFCYLVNPYFPSDKMLDEMKANFEPLLRDYPSGMRVNSLLAGKYFGIKQKYVVVGNGAAELIKSLMEDHEGKIGITYPTFEEYPNRISDAKIVRFYPENDRFYYSADDLMNFFSDKDISSLLIVNPDNPSGNFIPFVDLTRLAEWSRDKGIQLIIDESFIDFSDDGFKNTLLKNEILEQFPTMCVMKSISKSYGVPGLRLGVLASANEQLICRMKENVAIWNINSFAEFYMQIYGKYERDYARSCDFFRKERKLFESELQQIPFLKVIPSQANYFLCELTERYTSHDLTIKLLANFNILIKDCSPKKGFHNNRHYVRIAIRDREDNSTLIQALKLL